MELELENSGNFGIQHATLKSTASFSTGLSI